MQNLFVYFISRLENSFFMWATPLNSTTNSAKWGMANFCPLSHAQCDAIKCYFNIRPLVIALLLLRSPSNIVRFIIAIIIYAINRMFRGRPFANMVIKCHEIIFPFIANSYASTTIIFKGFIVRIVTTLKNIAPYAIFRSMRHAMSVSILFKRFFGKATATFCMTIANICTVNRRYFTASASANPTSFALFGIFSSFNNSKTSKSFSGKINKFRHDINPQAKVASILGHSICGGQLLEDCFSGMTLATHGMR